MRSRTFTAIALAVPSILVALALAPRQATPAATPIPDKAAGTYKVDRVHSSCNFRVEHLAASMFWGRFDDVNGTIAYTPGSSGSLEFDIRIPVASVHGGDEKLDNHLRGPDFFNAKEFPEMTFKSTKATPAGGKMWKVEGDLTLLGVTKPVTAMIEWIGFSEPRGKKLIGFEASFTITRSDFGMDYQVDQGGLGDEVSIIVGLEAVSS
ncbi:MAG: YceI family protein [Phycisphaerales bacterium]|jgi:polyisoprenoid-binding protein YceI